MIGSVEDDRAIPECRQTLYSIEWGWGVSGSMQRCRHFHEEMPPWAWERSCTIDFRSLWGIDVISGDVIREAV